MSRDIYEFVLDYSYNLKYSPPVDAAMKKEAEKQRRFEMKQQKKRDKHRGK